MSHVSSDVYHFLFPSTLSCRPINTSPKYETRERNHFYKSSEFLDSTSLFNSIVQIHRCWPFFLVWEKVVVLLTLFVPLSSYTFAIDDVKSNILPQNV